MIPMFNSLIISQSYLVPKYGLKTIDISRTWKERLFTRPWRPWIKTKQITVEDTEMLVMYKVGNVIYCHPDVMEKVKQRILMEGLVGE